MTNPNLTTCTPAQLRALLVATDIPHEAMHLTIHSDGTLAVAPLFPAQDHRNYGPGKLQAYLYVSSSASENEEALDDSVMESILRDARWAIADGAFFRID
ncbi:hypothetical protein [Deinococcus sp. AJ005]|uniref:hypothetical protein n=1 Tax=Deinococcus sp. AJ005 TaxID=2652443 RepID=UPI00125CD0AC|nr:hypothetical protein [Deinococcus sp. AJ005]QFP77465.1 hypothetical protein DAAJ005_14090 [Deinococcus sp. AJ005]